MPDPKADVRHSASGRRPAERRDLGSADSRLALEQHRRPRRELHVGGEGETSRPTTAGAREFDDLPAGASVKRWRTWTASISSRRSSRRRRSGGIRLMLVATDKNKSAAPSQPQAPAVTGTGDHRRPVAHRHAAERRGGRTCSTCSTSRTPREPGESADAVRVRPAERRARARRLCRDRRRRRRVSGTSVTVDGPFAPGHTFVQVGVRAAGRRRHDRSRRSAFRPTRAARGGGEESRRQHAASPQLARPARDAGAKATCSSRRTAAKSPPGSRSS